MRSRRAMGPRERRWPRSGLDDSSYNRSVLSGAAPPAWRLVKAIRRRRAPPRLVFFPGPAALIAAGFGRERLLTSITVGSPPTGVHDQDRSHDSPIGLRLRIRRCLL
jgi:hypothetical protein